jgi:hypothetical protein
MGVESEYAPMLIGAGFTFGIIGLMVVSVHALRGPNRAALAGLMLLSSPAFHVHGATQASDFPVAFFILGTFALLMLSESDTGRRNAYIALAGVFAGLSAWTKNEGFLFIVALVVARGVVLLARREGPRIKQEVVPFLAGLGPVLVFIFFYKISFAPVNDLIEAQGSETLARLTDLSRYLTVGKEFLYQLVRLDARFSTPFVFLAAVLLLHRVDRASFRQIGVLTPLLTALLMAAGYFIVFVTTYFEITWHLYTANVRLFIHFWPAVTFACALVLAGGGRRSAAPLPPQPLSGEAATGIAHTAALETDR